MCIPQNVKKVRTLIYFWKQLPKINYSKIWKMNIIYKNIDLPQLTMGSHPKLKMHQVKNTPHLAATTAQPGPPSTCSEHRCEPPAGQNHLTRHWQWQTMQVASVTLVIAWLTGSGGRCPASWDRMGPRIVSPWQGLDSKFQVRFLLNVLITLMPSLIQNSLNQMTVKSGAFCTD